MSNTANASEVTVRTEGAVEPVDVAYGRTKLADLVADSPIPVRLARLDMSLAANPAQERPARVKGRLDLDGRVVRADVSTPTVREAVDAATTRLRRQIERATELRRSNARRLRDDAWHHGAPRAPKPAFFDRPVDERDIVRRKTYAPTAMHVDDAIRDAALLDHDFYLYRDVDEDADRVVARDADSWRTVTPLRCALDEARNILDLGEAAFVFFVDEQRVGRVLYRRYDGHYGLVEPA